jgi:CubicO group peptidase (beta-lactamase class C family)
MITLPSGTNGARLNDTGVKDHHGAHFPGASCLAQKRLADRVDEFIKAEMARQQVPGLSLAVVKDGRPLIVKGYGLANIEHQVPVKPETIFQSGSVAKQFTATAIMLLAGDQKLALDDKISKYLGEIPPSWKNITIRHLLGHTGGMTDYPPDLDLRRDYTEDEMLSLIKGIPLAFAPGEKWQYSNLGYVTLGILIHKVTGKFYGDILSERIFRPFGMTTARVISESDIVPNRAAGYQLRRGEIKNQEWVSPSVNTTADGSLYLSALDMLRWDEALSGDKLLSRPALQQMWTPVKLKNGRSHGYGFGWSLRNVNGQALVEHGGAWQGFKAHIARYPDNRLTVIVFANLEQTNQSRIVHGVAAIVDPKLKPELIKDTDPTVSARFRESGRKGLKWQG